MKTDTAQVDALIDTLRTFHDFVNDVIDIANDRVGDDLSDASNEDIISISSALWAIRDVIKTAANNLL